MVLTTKRISAIMACYNDAGSVMVTYERLVQALQKVTLDYGSFTLTMRARTKLERCFRSLPEKTRAGGCDHP